MARKIKVNQSKTNTIKNISGNRNSSWYKWIVFIAAFLLYANTITHDYTQDDAIVIYDNMYTTQGVSGIPGLLTKDTFYGFFKTEGKAKLVAGGRYRPLTPIMFALEYEMFGRSPKTGHLINIFLYSLLCMLIYNTLLILLKPRFFDQKGFYVFILIASLLFAVHPIHTEAVANIKGRDEIMSMMGAILGLYFSLRYYDSGYNKYLIGIFVAFFLGLMSKETTITFLAVIPLSIYFFRNDGFKKLIKPLGTLLAATLVFLAIRFSVLGLDFGGTPMELMNNPFLKIDGNAYVPFSFAEKSATIIFTLGKYILLLLFPHPLTHDYYPRHIEMMSFGSWKVILSALLYVGMAIVGIIGIKNKKIISYGILYFLITVSIVSNIVFPIGTNMSERFMFMPSLGFCLIIGYFIFQAVKNWDTKKTFIVLAPLFVVYSFKTVTRNNVWKNDFTLFTTDVKTSTNSAKVLNAAGGALVAESNKTKNNLEKSKMLNQAIPYLEKALTIHPNYRNAALILGNAYFYKKDFDNAIKSYEQVLRISPNNKDASKNLAIALRDAGRNAGEIKGDIPKAQSYLKRSLALNDSDVETNRLLGITYGMMGDHQKAISYFETVVKLSPDIAVSYVNLGKAYQNFGDEASARIAFHKALELDPNAMEQ
ncbi:MAG: tetratricopeptide repeat protein [Saprospiraceae bacterium]